MSFYDYKNEEEFKKENGYEIDGQWYPRVTKIIGIKAKPALYRYYAEAQNFSEANNQTKKSAEEGTLIHEAVQNIMLGKTPAVDPSIAPAIEAYLDFTKKINIQVDPDFIEKRVYSIDHRYAGTIDALALIDGKVGVLDIKTSLAIYRDYNLQTAAYMYAIEKDPKISYTPQNRWILRIDQQRVCARCKSTLRTKGGREKIKKPYPLPYGVTLCPPEEHEWGPVKGIIELKEFPYWQTDFEAFLGAKKLWEWENEKWLKRIGFLK